MRSMSPVGVVCMDVPDDCTAVLKDAEGREVDGQASGAPPAASLSCVWEAPGPAHGARTCAGQALPHDGTTHAPHCLLLSRPALQTALPRWRWRCWGLMATCTRASSVIT